MQSKPNYYQDHGTFCGLIAYKNTEHNILGMGPDYVKLNRRFQVTNGVHNVDSEALHLRNMSYLMMIGDN